MQEIEVLNATEEPEGAPEFIPARVATKESALVEMGRAMHIGEQLAAAAMALTRPQDWAFFGERPWLCRSGAEGIRRRMGLTITLERDPQSGRKYTMFKDSDEKGDYIVVELAGTISHPSLGSIDVFGFATTRDQLFGREGTDSEGKAVWKPLSEVNIEHVKMKAYTNLWTNAIVRFLGLSPSKEDIDKRFGDKVAKVGFRQKEEARTPETVADESKKGTALWALLLTMSEGDEATARELLADLTKFKAKDGKDVPGVRDVNRLKGQRLDIACSNGKKRWEDFLAKNPVEAEFLKALLKAKLEAQAQA